MKVKALFFDLDETLLDDDRAFRIAVARTCIDLAHYDGIVDPHRLRETYLAIAERFWTDLGLLRSWTSLSGSDGQKVRRLLWTQSLEEQGVSSNETIDQA